MKPIEWNDALTLGVDPLDETHRDFIAHIATLAAAQDDQVLHALDALNAHTSAHFEQESRWMRDCEFPPLGCHEGEHQKILELCVELRARIADGTQPPAMAARLAEALMEWFEQHAASMDAVLAQWMQSRGYVPALDADLLLVQPQ